MAVKPQNPSGPRIFLTIEDAAQLVGLSHWTIRMWLRTGKLPKYKSGTRTLVREGELLALIKPQPQKREAK